MTLYYKTPTSIIAGTSLRYPHGTSQPPYDAFNTAFTVKDKEMAVLANRLILANEVNLHLEQWIWAGQCHSTNIRKVTQEDAGKGALSTQTALVDTDGLYTFESNLALAFVHADCVPVLFYDTSRHLIGAIHAGWPGLAKNVLATCLGEVIEKEGLNPQLIQVHLGPHLSAKHSRVKKESSPLDLDHLHQVYGDDIKEIEPGIYQINETGLALKQLEAVGIVNDHIDICSECTYDHPDKYYSVQRDGLTGRHTSFIVQK